MSMLRSITSRITGMSFHRLPVQNHNTLEFNDDAFKEISQKLGHLFLAKRLTPEDSKKLLEYTIKALSPHSDAAEIDSIISEFNNKKALSPDFLKEYFQEIQESKISLFVATSKISIPKNIQKLMTLLWLYAKDQTLLSIDYDHRKFGFEKFKSDLANKSVSDAFEDDIFDNTVLEFIIFKIQNNHEYTLPGFSIKDKISKDSAQQYIKNILISAIKMNNIKAVKLVLIYRKIDINTAKTPILVIAIKQKIINLDIIKQLILYSHIGKNKEGKKDSPLFWAAKRGHIVIVEMLIATGEILTIKKAYNYLKYLQKELPMRLSNNTRECLNLLDSYTLLLEPLFSKKSFPTPKNIDELLGFTNNLRKKFLWGALEAKDISYVFLKTTLQGAIIEKMLRYKVRKKDGSLYTFQELRTPGDAIKGLSRKELKAIEKQLPKKKKGVLTNWIK